MTSKTRYVRTHRHRTKSKLRHRKSVRRHARISGRTGSIHQKRTPSSKPSKYRRLIQNSSIIW